MQQIRPNHHEPLRESIRHDSISASAESVAALHPLPAPIAASIDMVGKVARSQHKVVAALMKQRKLQMLQAEHNVEEHATPADGHRFFPLRRMMRRHSNGHTSSEEFESDEMQVQQNPSGSSSRLGVRERFQRWHVHSKQASEITPPRTAIKAQTATDSIFTADTALMSNSSKTNLYGESSLLSMGRLSSRLSIGSSGYEYPSQRQLPRPLQAQPKRPNCCRINEEDSKEVNPQDETSSRRATSNYEPAGANCSTGSRFFASHPKRPSVSTPCTSPFMQVHDLELTLDEDKGEMGLYTGTLDMDSKKPHGKGKMLYFCTGCEDDRPLETSQEFERPSSEPFLIYDGQWAKGDWCGFGTLVDLRHGHTYEGGFFDNYKHGLGVLQYGDGRIYDGIFAFGKLEGKGHLEYSDGSTYWGHWTSDGIEHGRGKKVFADGRVYDGEFDNGMLHGHGKMTYADGSWYLGEWCDGEPNGLGIQVAVDGNLEFEGTFIHGRPIQSASCPSHRKSEGDFLCYRSSLAKHGTLVGNIPKHVYMRDDSNRYAR